MEHQKQKRPKKSKKDNKNTPVCGLNFVKAAMVVRNNGSYKDFSDALHGLRAK